MLFRAVISSLAMFAFVTQARQVAAGDASTNAPLAPDFNVARYEVAGSDVLDAATVARAMRDATGTNVSLLQIRRSLLKLQQAYRDRGHIRAALRLPRQPLTNGVVHVEVALGNESSATASATSSALNAWTVPTYEVQHFEVRGNRTLSAEEINHILGPVAGVAVTQEQIEKALVQLRAAYWERGLTDVVIAFPEQLLTDGNAVVQVTEGEMPPALTEPVIATTPVPPPPSPKFEVRQYEVSGNTLLPWATVDRCFTNAVGAEVSLEQIQKALGELQLAYRERGFATVLVALPQQQLTNAIVKVQVTEGRLVDVRVVGNDHFSSNNIIRALPTAREALLWKDATLNSLVFQRELDVANQNRDRQIYPTIVPGPEPGTSALTLKVKDRLPLHGRLELNNYSTPGTPDWRINSSLQYNNVWQREHQLGLSYGFTPEEYKSGDQLPDYWLNRPLIAYYGGYYRIPFGTADASAQRINNSTGFGYDEATRQFRLPPAGGRPDLTLFGSISSSDTGVQYGPATTVSQTPLLTIVSQDSGQNLSINDAAGGRFNLPKALSDTQRLNVSFGLDWKRYWLQSLNTNNFIITTVITNSQGVQTIESRVASPQPVRENETTYLPLALGLDYSSTDRSGMFTASLGLGANFTGSQTNFSQLAYSSDADPNYGKVTLALTRDQKVFKNWSLLLRANGQAATGALLSTEQFALGGNNSVRGYFEGDEYGDSGWFTGAELRTPFINTRVPGWSGFVPTWVRGSVFMDYGQRFLLDAPAGVESERSLWGLGFGLSANINNHFDAKLTVAWPLTATPNTPDSSPRAYLSIGGQF
jgi:hemolysin activation/secretion protein